MRVKSTMGESLNSEIEQIRARLDEIVVERDRFDNDADPRHGRLLEEEHRLEARLTRLEDEVSQTTSGEAEEKAARQTDLTRAPKLPEDTEDE